MELQIPDSKSTEKLLFPIVAIGASAGGLHSFESFLQELPSEFHFAIIFIQHLSPTYKSLMPELLHAQRPDLKFEGMGDGQSVLPGHIYIYPPHEEIRIQQGAVHMYPGTGNHRLHPIDDFLVSLSQDVSERIIAVILSGAGTDGARGVQAIKAVGGTVFAQDPGTAEFPSMPMASINTGKVDGILAPQDIARRLLTICDAGMPSEPSEGPDESTEFDPFLRLIYDKTGHRFNHCKKNVLARRIRRRMNLHGISSATAYLDMLAANNSEAKMLTYDLLIGVTSFFRDRLAWNALETEVVKQLVAKKYDSPIRIWTPACATGEESYSIAMMLQDELDRSGSQREMQIFASDIDERALEKARAGTYPESVVADIPPEYIKKFMSYTSDGLAVNVSSDIRQHMIFARHDLMTDPPFSRLDLIICRNLLIYIEPYAQDKCISLFDYALNDGGYLFLGSAESLGGKGDAFQSIGQKTDRIYQKIEGKASPKKTLSFPLNAPHSTTYPSKDPLSADHRPTLEELAKKALFDKFVPAAVAINENYEIIYFYGPLNIYLLQPEGRPTHNLLDLVPTSMRSRIRGALYKVIHTDKPALLRATILDGKGRKRQVTLDISKTNENLFLITFQEKSGPAKSEGLLPDISDLNETAVRQLENELCSTREDLQSHIEQLESLSEELQSSNEELQASSEEMETSREELQSLNEELLTVNAQLQTKIEEQDETNNDLVNFLTSTNIPTLFLDRHLRLKRFTPAMEKLITLIPADAGRSIADMSQENLGPDLIAHAKAILDNPVPIRDEIRIGDTRYVRTALPYLTAESRIEGVVITYNDVTELKIAEERQRFLASFPQINPTPILEVSTSGEVTFANPATMKALGETVSNKQDASVFLPSDFDAVIKERGKEIEATDYREVTVNGRIYGETVHVLPQFNVARIYAYDITEHRRAEDAVKESKEQISQILNSTAEGIYGLDPIGNCTFCNPSSIKILGYADENDLIGKNMHELIHHTKADGAPYPKDECAAYRAITKGEYIHRDRDILWRSDGTSFPAEFWAHPIFKGNGIVGTVVTFIDITERVILENQLVHAQKMEAVGQLAGGIAHDFNNLLTAITGHGSLLQAKLDQEDPRRADIEQILESADKAAEVTRSLLAFSRQEIMNARPININDLVRKFEKLLSRIIGEEIEVITSLAPEDIVAMADSIRMEQVLMNLATNARDAMPHGGILTIRTERAELVETSLPSLGPVAPGPYAVISVSDSGVGINQETLAKIFEPFFTTKELGKGTGLGLSMVYGIIKEHGGYINVESETGMGTIFKIYLPVAVPDTEEIVRPTVDSQPVGGTETVLIAEDDDKLRKLFGVVLTQYGYNAIYAENGEAAVSKFMENKDKVDLVLMDMIMPRKSGMEAYSEIRKIRPDMKIIFLSGYTADRIDSELLNNSDVHLILKPVSPMDLLRKVRDVLGK